MERGRREEKVLQESYLEVWTSQVVLVVKILTLTLKSLSRVRLFVTPWTVAYQALPSMEFSRQEYWSGFPFPSPGDLSNPGIEPWSPALQADALSSEPPGRPQGLFSLVFVLFQWHTHHLKSLLILLSVPI